MNRREFISGVAACAATGWGAGGCLSVSGVGRESTRWSFDGKHSVRFVSPLVREPVRIRFIADTHLALVDDRDRDYAPHCARMKQWPGEKATFEGTLPRPGECDLLVLGGDIISFPTLANVDYLKARLEACGVPYAYVAGNHDWHFEGDTGSDLEQRERWIARRLRSLYNGRDPLASVIDVKGVKIALVDNSAYHITPEQVDCFKRETAGNDPVLLFQHVPFWSPGMDVTTCCSPGWGAANDPYWKIERRERWAERLMPSTHAFRAAVCEMPNLLGVFAGHLHRQWVADVGCHPQFVVSDNRTGAYFDVDLCPAADAT